MKKFYGVLALALAVLALSGCSTCGKKSACSNCAAQTAPAPVEVAAPVVPAPVEAVAPVAEEAAKPMTEEQVMAAVSK